MQTQSISWRLAWVAALIAAVLACGREAASPTPPLATTPAATVTTAAEPASTQLPATNTSAPPTEPPATDVPTSTPLPLPSATAPDFSSLAGTIARDVTYCMSAEGVALKLDLYFPPKMDAPQPAVVFMHGGGWSEGDKRQGVDVFSGLVEQYFVVASLNYRLAPEYIYPAQIVDVKCAVRFLRANAAAYGVDPARIGSMGTSAGAHLAAILGLTDETAGWDLGPHLEQSSQVQAVVTFFAPIDLTQDFVGIHSAIDAGVFGPNPSASLLAEASPIKYVTAGDAPFLLIHGAQDNFVPPTQSQLLYDNLLAAGVPAELVFVQGAGHAFISADYPVKPSREELLIKVAAFFTQYLK
jgi:acetyl esterase/lipase